MMIPFSQPLVKFPTSWRQPMVCAVLLSLVIHVTLLLVRWHQESEEARRLRTPLSVVLVNARSHAPAQSWQTN